MTRHYLFLLAEDVDRGVRKCMLLAPTSQVRDCASDLDPDGWLAGNLSRLLKGLCCVESVE